MTIVSPYIFVQKELNQHNVMYYKLQLVIMRQIKLT